jgi:hypothetical protein
VHNLQMRQTYINISPDSAPIEISKCIINLLEVQVPTLEFLNPSSKSSDLNIKINIEGVTMMVN